jgi:hypothetical protein
MLRLQALCSYASMALNGQQVESSHGMGMHGRVENATSVRSISTQDFLVHKSTPSSPRNIRPAYLAAVPLGCLHFPSHHHSALSRFSCLREFPYFPTGLAWIGAYNHGWIDIWFFSLLLALIRKHFVFPLTEIHTINVRKRPDHSEEGEAGPCFFSPLFAPRPEPSPTATTGPLSPILSEC